ncbi:MAG: FecR domain-containing protein [Candidatus Omnitrophica bacterium]|nr:FecR domain-containing protein [Candidatus Omnitrophota bacterium]
MKKIAGIVIITAMIATISFLTKGFAEEEQLAISAQEASILFMEGEVKVKRQSAAGWIDAEVDMILSKGDNLKTGPESWAEIGFGKGLVNVVRVRENTLLELIDLGPVRLGLLKGELRSLVESLSGDTTFEIKTPTAVCGARGTGWDTNTDGKQVIVDAYEDEVYFYAVDKDGNPVMEDPIIKAGKRGILAAPMRPITIKNIPINKIKSWNGWKRDIGQKRALGKRVSTTIKQKIVNIQKTQKSVESLTKGKLSVLEKKQKDKIEQRVDEEKKSTEDPYP